MTLIPGTRLGAYEVVAQLGVGAMGEVYRARDTQLGREVALKVLPESLVKDPDRVARFRREAQLLASLNHPHIGAIYALEEWGDVPILVLELVEGKTLAELIAARRVNGTSGSQGSGLSINETLTIARQIADALEAAHEEGVVHRDLKPANIKVRPDGTVKVLDFGIAKALAREGTSTQTDTPTAMVTRQGMLIGTVAYMSPEQTRGAGVTRRSDVWAFGVILFEMLTGTRPFDGTSESDVLAAILQTVPDWSALPPEVPSTIRRLVQRCLERDPKARLHDIGDARLEIEDAEKMLNLGATADATRMPPDLLADRRHNSLRVLYWVVGLIGVAAIAAAAYVLGVRGRSAAQEVRLQMPPPAGTHFVSAPAVSPDGRHVAFVAVPDAGGPTMLWLRSLAASAPTELAGTEDASYPFWSSDGRSLAFFSSGALKRLAVPAGGSIVICEAAAGRGGVWLDDNSIIFAPSQFSPLMRVSAAGGQPTPLTTLAEDETSHRFPQRLPGRQLLYFSANRTPAKSGTRLISLDAPERAMRFFDGISVAGYVNGFIVFVRLGTPTSVLAQQMTLPSGELRGEPFEVGRVRSSEAFGRSAMSTAASGVIASAGEPDAIGQFTWISRDGRQVGTIGTPETQLGVELSRDGERLATVRSNNIWTLDLARPVPSRVTLRNQSVHPVWSPDGTRIASMYMLGTGTFDLEVTETSTGNVKTLIQGSTANMKPVGWTPDGRGLVVIQTVDKSVERAIWTIPVDDPGNASQYRRDGGQVLEARLSPDGKWIAYATDLSGRFEVEVRSFPVPGAKHPISLEGGGYPRWRADGLELYFVSPNSQIMAVGVTAGKVLAFTRPEPLFEVKLVAHPDRGNFAAYEYDVNADGTRFLVNRQVSEPSTSMTIIIGWTPQR